MPTRHHVVVVGHFLKADKVARLQTMRRSIEVLESTILSLTNQLKQVTETHDELLDMVNILLTDEEENN
jgi:hypothetical protein